MVLADVVQLDPGGWLSWALAGLLAGWLASRLVRGRGFGCLGDIVLGLVGAAVGALLLNALPHQFAATLQLTGNLHFLGTLVVAFLGALTLAIIGRLLGGRGPRRRLDWSRQQRVTRP